MNLDLWSQRFTQALELQGRSPQTIRSYGYELRQFFNFLEDRGLRELHELDTGEVSAYQVHLHRRRKPNGDPLNLRTLNCKMAAVVAFSKFLYRSRYLLLDPSRDVTFSRVPRRLLPGLLDEEEVERLLEAPDTSHPLGLRDRAALEVLYSSALRNRELRLLKVGDVDLVRLELRVLQGKGGHERVVPLGEPAGAWVEEYLRCGRGFLLRSEDPGFLFLSLRGGHLGNDTLNQVVKRAAEAAGLDKRVTPHILRHCCATHMLRRQARLRHLQALLGHASPDTTQRYTQVEISDLREVHQRCHPRESF